MNYLKEWRNSCVDEQITRLNVVSLQGNDAMDYLFYSDQLPRRNDGRITSGYLQRYAHTEEGGWWCSGMDILTGNEDLWGCFKPLQPRHNENKLVKYEHPPKTGTGIFALRIPLYIWESIAQRYNVAILPSDIQENQADLGFWSWVINNPTIPLCITEGAKKAGTLLTAGFLAIAVPGINGGYRTPKDKLGRRCGKSHLISPLELLSNSQREIYFTFDQDQKPNTIKAVNSAIKKCGYLLKEKGCQVKVMTWDSQLGKGVDDLIANQGEKAFLEAYNKALSLEIWQAKALYQLTYPANIELNCRYLSQSKIVIDSEAKIVGIKSLQGTGKTEFLTQIVKKALALGQPVLVIGHRIKLVEQLCQRFGIKYVTEVEQNGEQISALGLCIDSLHPNSQANFKAENWQNALVIIDEIEQVIWHCLNSNTCKNNRIAILNSLKKLLGNVVNSNGKIVVSDAYLSDLSLKYLINLSGLELEPFIIKNNWKPTSKEAWQTYHYDETTPKRLIKDLENYIREGGKPFICLSAQKLKSKWGTLSLEGYFNKQFPDLKILRIDSESLSDSNHPAYGCITSLNKVLNRYDVVLVSPSIETGVSIDLLGHFTSVWCISQGVQDANSVTQMLARIRDNVPRYLWVAKSGFNRIGNGTTSIPHLLTCGNRLTQVNIRLLQQSDFANLDDLDTSFQAESLLCWASLAVRVNANMLHYRESVYNLLQESGHVLLPCEEKPSLEKNDNPLMEAIAAVQQENYRRECESICLAKDISAKDYDLLQKQMVKTSEIRRILRKYELQERYQIEVTPDLIIKDDQGWYRQIRLHYFLTVGRSFLAQRDAKMARRLMDQGKGSIFGPDFNACQLGSTIAVMEILKIPQLLLDTGRELRNTDLDLQQLGTMALNYRNDIKSIMGITIAKNSSPIMVVRRFIGQIGYGLTTIKCERNKDQKRVRVYLISPPQDNRQEIFEQWLKLDHL